MAFARLSDSGGALAPHAALMRIDGDTLMGHSAHLGTATCPSSKLVPKFEKGDNLMKHVYLAYGGKKMQEDAISRKAWASFDQTTTSLFSWRTSFIKMRPSLKKQQHRISVCDLLFGMWGCVVHCVHGIWRCAWLSDGWGCVSHSLSAWVRRGRRVIPLIWVPPGVRHQNSPKCSNFWLTLICNIKEL